MNCIKVFVVLVVFSILAGCSDPKIDASSDEAMKASVEKVRKSLSETKQNDFDEAIQVLVFSQIDMKSLFSKNAAEAGSLEGKARELLDGKTGEQVIAEAERVRTERKEREHQQALEEIRELEKKREKSEIAREQLKNFNVLRSRFYMREREFMGKQPIIELTVRNGTDQAVSRAYFEGTLASPDRSVPWHQGMFSYSIPGGVEPGEEATWNLAPNMFSGWGKVDAPSDAVFTVTVEQLDGANGEPFYSTRKFGERERDRFLNP